MAAARLVEFLLLFGALPLFFALRVRRSASRAALIAALWVPAVWCLFVMYRDPAFDRSVLFRLPLDHPYMRVVLLRFVILGGAIALLGRTYAREAFLYLPRHLPGIFALIVFAYPLLSVLPQGIVWRVFLVHRYAAFVPDPTLFLILGAVAFAFAHVAFRNLIAIGLTFVGGVVFLQTYMATRSMILASLEHAAYGLTVFTFGFGRYIVLRKAPDATAPRRS